MAIDPFNITSFVPDDDEQPSADEALAELERPLDEVLEPDIAVAEDEPPPIGKGWAFDVIAGRFVRGGSGPRVTHGLATLLYWVDICLHVDRGAHAIYSDSFGMEKPFDLIGRPVLGVPVADFNERIRVALTEHPRIDDVVEFETTIDDQNGNVHSSFRLVVDDDTEVPLTVILP